MIGFSLQQELATLPDDDMAKRIALKILNAPKADLKKLEEDKQELMKQFLKSHNLTEFPL